MLHRKLLLPFAAFCAMAGVSLAQTVDIVLPTGAGESLQTRLEGASLTRALATQSEVNAQDYVAAARADYRRLLTGLYGAGYYSGAISIRIDGREASTIAPLDAPRQIASVVISVDPGPRFTFGEAQIGPLAPQTELPEGFANGQVARATVIQQATTSAISAWRDAGYALATPGGQQISANHPARTLDANIAIDTGPVLSFGPVTINGNEAVRTDRVRDIAGIPQSRFSPYELDRAAQRLRRTGAFRSVAIVESETAGPAGTLPIEVQVVEQAPRRIGFGAEYSTLDGATLSAFWLHRNFLGGAERFRLDAEISGIDGGTGGIDYSLGASFGRPATFRPDVNLLATATLQHEDEPNYRLDSLGAEIGLTQYRTDRLTYGAGIGFVTAREVTDARTREYTLLTLPLSGTYDRRDVPLDPASGFYVDLEVTPFVGLSGGANGARLYGDLRAYQSFGPDDRLTFAGRLQLGSVTGASLADAPADYLFSSGGGGTVRGQAYQSLGVDLTRDFGAGPVTVQSGGASFVGAQLEARFGVTKNIGLVGFYDVGLVGDRSVPDTDDEWHAGAGLGLRYDTGIGPIRLDIATPTTGENAGERVEVYIGIGQSF